MSRNMPRKRIKSFLRRPQGLSSRPSHERQDKATVELFRSGFSVEEITTLLRRSESAVLTALRQAVRP